MLPVRRGFFLKEHTPIYRGFNTSYGFLTGGEDHYSEATICGAPVCGIHTKSIDIWDSDKPAYEHNGTWSAQLFAEAAQRVIRAHDAVSPLFLYFALHNTHGPTQAPQRLIDLYDGHDDCRTVGNLSDCAIIHTFAAMITAVDETVFNVTTTLKESGLWENTLLIWTTDNGAEINHQLPGCGELHPIPSAVSGVGGSPGYCGGGSNAPFRGGKGSARNGRERACALPCLADSVHLGGKATGKVGTASQRLSRGRCCLPRCAGSSSTASRISATGAYSAKHFS